jgi:CHASE3 domain sensor protein
MVMEKLTPATLPVIHLNGTGAESLYEEYSTARKAVSQAMDELVQATCHPRDFYLVEGSWDKARQERSEMLQKLNEVCSYLEQWETVAYEKCRKVK